MILTINDDFDLAKVADSGQCFRFNVCDNGKELTAKEGAFSEAPTYRVVASDKLLYIKQTGESEYELSCSEDEYENFWKGYFDLDLSYSDIRGRIDESEDPYLFAASEFGKGIRILRQDPWEMLISFIISQRKNIPAIKASIEKLCALAGEKIGEEDGGEAVFSFPNPGKLAALSLAELGSCSLGYRDKYVHQAAMDVAGGAVNLYDWKDLSDSDLMENLLKLYGVGVKVANCEILFGYHRLDAFPKDVWINRVLDIKYPGGFLFDKYAPYNGVMQQYLFFYSRLGEL
jgi:N-glycosylase/DNA lyase